MLSAERIEVRAGAHRLVSELDLNLRPGQCWALLGPNGSGKSSLILALAGLRPPATGRILLDGQPLSRQPRRTLAGRIGVLLQDESADYWGSLLDYVLLGRYPHSGAGAVAQGKGHRDGETAARHWIAALDLQPHAAQAYRTLSGGERQRGRIAQLLVQDPEILLLDEPLNHLDLRHQRQVMDVLSASAGRGRTVLMALHDPYIAARYCDHAILLYHAARASVGRSSEMLTQASLEALYQCPLETTATRTFVPS
jgi:iron complex transport system ATP-binding protein